MLTVREAARLQSFPDWFEFEGAQYRQFQMIGNAVPPLLGFALAQQMLTFLEGNRPVKTARKISVGGQFALEL
jgi:DNA (cytosine-5)-methyltransferase 1